MNSKQLAEASDIALAFSAVFTRLSDFLLSLDQSKQLELTAPSVPNPARPAPVTPTQTKISSEKVTEFTITPPLGVAGSSVIFRGAQAKLIFTLQNNDGQYSATRLLEEGIGSTTIGGVYARICDANLKLRKAKRRIVNRDGFYFLIDQVPEKLAPVAKTSETEKKTPPQIIVKPPTERKPDPVQPAALGPKRQTPMPDGCVIEVASALMMVSGPHGSITLRDMRAIAILRCMERGGLFGIDVIAKVAKVESAELVRTILSGLRQRLAGIGVDIFMDKFNARLRPLQIEGDQS